PKPGRAVALVAFLSEQGIRSATSMKRARRLLAAHSMVLNETTELTEGQTRMARRHFRNEQFRVCAACSVLRRPSQDEDSRPITVDPDYCDVCWGKPTR